MKIPNYLKKSIYLSISLSIYSNLSYAVCNVPKNVESNSFIMINNTPYSSNNPMAGQVYNMTYGSGGKYSYTIINESGTYSGSYTYQVIESSIARITSTETFANTPTNYTITLICNTATSGNYFYQQSNGVGGVRSNSGIYIK
jgi:hypothetical protein